MGPSNSTETSTADQAISDIVDMQPRRVTVQLTLPVEGGAARPVVVLEWTREDTNMPLSELLGRIQEYVGRYSVK